MNEQMEDLVLLFLQGDLDEAGARTLLAEFDRSPDLRDQAVRMYRMQIFLQRLGRHDALEQAVWRSLDSMSRFPSARRQMIEENVVGRLERSVGTAMISGSKTTSEHNRQPKGSSPSTIPFTRRWAFWTSIAAGILTMLGMYWVNTTRVRPAAYLVVTVVTPGGGAVARTPSGLARTLDAGSPVYAGESVAVGGQGSVTLCYSGEATTLELRGGLARVYAAQDGAKRMDLNDGRLHAKVAPQREPMVIQTPHATATVRGTILDLAVREKDTRLAVEEGNVALCHGGKILEVRAGETAVATAQGLTQLSTGDAWIRELLARAEAGAAPDFAPFRATDSNALCFVEKRTGAGCLFWNAQGAELSQVLFDLAPAKRGVFVASLMIPPEGKLPPELAPPGEAKPVECLKGDVTQVSLAKPAVVLTYRFDKPDLARGNFAKRDFRNLLPLQSEPVRRGVWYRCVVYVDAETTPKDMQFFWTQSPEETSITWTSAWHQTSCPVPVNASSFGLGLAARDLPVLARGLKFVPLGADMPPFPGHKRD